MGFLGVEVAFTGSLPCLAAILGSVRGMVAAHVSNASCGEHSPSGHQNRGGCCAHVWTTVLLLCAQSPPPPPTSPPLGGCNPWLSSKVDLQI